MSLHDGTIEQFYRYLNSRQWLPEPAYRRNSGLYPLVCYVNTVIGASLSSNHEIAALFVARSVDYMEHVQPRVNEEPYYALVAGYFSHVIDEIRHIAPHIVFDTDRIPAVLLNASFPAHPEAVLRPDAQELYFWRRARTSSHNG